MLTQTEIRKVKRNKLNMTQNSILNFIHFTCVNNYMYKGDERLQVEISPTMVSNYSGMDRRNIKREINKLINVGILEVIRESGQGLPPRIVRLDIDRLEEYSD